MKRIFCLICSILALVAATSCSDEALHYGGGFDPAAAESVSIAHLKSYSTDRLVRIDRSIYIEAVVTANDHYGEFPRSLFVQDQTGAIELKIEGTRLYTRYPLGLRLRIFCDGLLLGSFGGKILLGEEADDSAWPTAIAREDASRRIHPLDGPYERVEPRRVALPLGDRVAVGELVRIDKLSLMEADGVCSWCERDPLSGAMLPTLRTLIDVEGDQLPLYVEATATYATEPLPMGRGSVCGILDYKEGEYCLRLVNRDISFE